MEPLERLRTKLDSYTIFLIAIPISYAQRHLQLIADPIGLHQGHRGHHLQTARRDATQWQEVRQNRASHAAARGAVEQLEERRLQRYFDHMSLVCFFLNQFVSSQQNSAALSLSIKPPPTHQQRRRQTSNRHRPNAKNAASAIRFESQSDRIDSIWATPS